LALDEISDSQLVGISCGKIHEWCNQNAEHEFVVIDLNNHKIRCHEYSGIFLNQLAGNRSFPSDNTAMDFTAAIISDILQILLLAKYTSPQFIVSQFKLTPQDETILYNFLVEFNLTRYIWLKTKAKDMQAKMNFNIQQF
jgi:hypothetical protein